VLIVNSEVSCAMKSKPNPIQHQYFFISITEHEQSIPRLSAAALDVQLQCLARAPSDVHDSNS
jgi:hypothetical protein